MDKISREKLTELIEKEDGNKWWSPEEFEKEIRSQLHTSLKIIAPPPAYAGNYNCFVFAFSLENEKEFLGGSNPVYQEFIKYLLDKSILETIEKPNSGGLVFYQDDSGTITHGGIMQGADNVVSKWMWGATIAHKLWDVPSSFGDKVFFCKSITSSVAKEEYKKYKNSGVIIESIL